MRLQCYRCCAKHLGQASALLTESLLGYPEHLIYAIGHLAEAEAEIVCADISLASRIREVRLMADLRQEPSDIAEMLRGIIVDVFEKTEEEEENE